MIQKFLVKKMLFTAINTFLNPCLKISYFFLKQYTKRVFLFFISDRSVSHRIPEIHSFCIYSLSFLWCLADFFSCSFIFSINEIPCKRDIFQMTFSKIFFFYFRFLSNFPKGSKNETGEHAKRKENPTETAIFFRSPSKLVLSSLNFALKTKHQL